MRALIVDDNMQSYGALLHFLKEQYPDLELVEKTNTILKGEQLMFTLQPDLVFWNISMRDDSQRDLIKRFEKKFFYTIKTISHGQYAIMPIGVEAISYLIQRSTPQEIAKAIEKTANKYMLGLENVKDPTNSPQLPTRIRVSNSIGFHYLPIENIVHFKAQGNYTEIILNRSPHKILASVNLKHYVDDFIIYSEFYQVHRSYLVNLKYVDAFVRKESHVVMRNGDEIPVSKKNRDKLLHALESI